MRAVNLIELMAFSLLMGYALAFVPGLLRDIYGRKKALPKTESGEDPRAILMILVLVVVVIFVRDVIVGSTPFGTETLGGFLEKREYTADYYVLAFPQGSESLNYRVVARLHAYRSQEVFGSIRKYEVLSFQGHDGARVTFSQQAGTGYSLVLNQRVPLVDDDGRRWAIQLTAEKANP